MGERKVLNRYIPPDFDPSIIPRSKRDYGAQIEVRMMLPFSMKCLRCGNFMYRGKKFNSKKETLQDETYLGIRIQRFYIKCSVCSAEITFKTDPKNTDYELETGATRNFELWKENDSAAQELLKKREEEDKLDVMKGLENRTLDSKVEMGIMDALDEIKAINQRHESVDTTDVLKKLHYNNDNPTNDTYVNKDGLTIADEQLIKSIKFKSKRSLDDSDHDDDEKIDKNVNTSIFDNIQKELQENASKSNAANTLPTVIVRTKKRRTVDSSAITSDDGQTEISKNEQLQSDVNVPDNKTNALNMFADYGDSD